MLSRVRFDDVDDMVSEDEEVGVDFFESARISANKWSTPALNEFSKDDYDGEWLLIGRFLSTMTMDTLWMKEEASRLRKKAYKFFLRGGKIWRHPKKRNGAPLRVVMLE
mgnify:CR=1 FL=1